MELTVTMLLAKATRLVEDFINCYQIKIFGGVLISVLVDLGRTPLHNLQMVLIFSQFIF